MNSVEIRIPQMGEGLREVLIVRLLKSAGDPVRRDEPLYEMETDKAVMEVESPHEGTLIEWLAAEGDVMEVNAPIARLTTMESVPPANPIAGPRPVAGAAHPTLAPTARPEPRITAPPPAGATIIPPRTRKYARELGLTDQELYSIPAPSGKLMPADLDRYLSLKNDEPSNGGDAQAPARGITPYPLNRAEADPADPTPSFPTRDPDPAPQPQGIARQYPVPAKQRVFIYRLKRSAQLTVPASITRPIDWGGVVDRLQALRRRYSETPVTAVTAFAHGVVTTVAQHPKFRSVLAGDDTVIEFKHLNLGIAVQRPDDELVTALVPEADSLDFPSFARTTQRQITRAIKGADQASDSVQLLLSYMADQEIIHAIPVLVSPAIAVLFVGAPYEQGQRTLANLVLTFDHRLINGVGAAKFLGELARRVADPTLPDPA